MENALKIRPCLVMVTLLAFAACAETTTQAPAVPDTDPLAGSEIRAVVDGGPYDVRIFDGRDAGTVARLQWDFDAGTVSGSFETADGETGNFSTPIRIQDDRLCVGEGDAGCHTIYAINGGFLEVNADGTVHAISRVSS